MDQTNLQGAVGGVRKQIKDVALYVKAIKENHVTIPENDNEDRGEVLANLTIAYRHLEDASMRLGKVLQAYDGGVSVYDKETTVGGTGNGLTQANESGRTGV